MTGIPTGPGGHLPVGKMCDPCLSMTAYLDPLEYTESAQHNPDVLCQAFTCETDSQYLNGRFGTWWDRKLMLSTSCRRNGGDTM